jgi:hypothetical protein
MKKEEDCERKRERDTKKGKPVCSVLERLQLRPRDGPPSWGTPPPPPPSLLNSLTSTNPNLTEFFVFFSDTSTALGLGRVRLNWKNEINQSDQIVSCEILMQVRRCESGSSCFLTFSSCRSIVRREISASIASNCFWEHTRKWREKVFSQARYSNWAWFCDGVSMKKQIRVINRKKNKHTLRGWMRAFSSCWRVTSESIASHGIRICYEENWYPLPQYGPFSLHFIFYLSRTPSIQMLIHTLTSLRNVSIGKSYVGRKRNTPPSTKTDAIPRLMG